MTKTSFQKLIIFHVTIALTTHFYKTPIIFKKQPDRFFRPLLKTFAAFSTFQALFSRFLSCEPGLTFLDISKSRD